MHALSTAQQKDQLRANILFIIYNEKKQLREEDKTPQLKAKLVAAAIFKA